MRTRLVPRFQLFRIARCRTRELLANYAKELGGGDHARPSNSLMALTTGARCLLAEIVATEGSGLIRLTSNVSLFNCQRTVTGVSPSKSCVRRLVELNGIEPMTSGLQSQRSPN